MARKWFGMRSATTKASAMGPTPRMAAMMTSRRKPVMRETSVQPPTDRILRNKGLDSRAQVAGWIRHGSDLRRMAIVAQEPASRIGGAPPAPGPPQERAALYPALKP